jgi:hypothetical protein
MPRRAPIWETAMKNFRTFALAVSFYRAARSLDLPAHLRDQAGSRFDMMRVLQCGGGGIHLDRSAAEFGGEGAPFRFAGKYIERRVSQRRQYSEKQDQ